MTAYSYQIGLRYMFSIGLDLNPRRIGESPAGIVSDIGVLDSCVFTDDLLYNQSWPSSGGQWPGLKGKLTSWQDWSVLRRDSVSEFNGKASIAVDGFLLGVVFSGCIDRASGASLKDASSIEQFGKTKRGDQPKVSVQLAVRFEGGQQPPSWADTGFRQPGNKDQYLKLFRGQYLGLGAVDFEKGEARRAALNIWEMETPWQPRLQQMGPPTAPRVAPPSDGHGGSGTHRDCDETPPAFNTSKELFKHIGVGRWAPLKKYDAPAQSRVATARMQNVRR